MNFETINFILLLYYLICILLGAVFTWFFMKKNSYSKSIEIEKLGDSLNNILQKHEELKLEKIEVEKQFAVLQNEARRIPNIEESLKKQQQNNSSLEILKASLEERLEAKENEAREKLKFLEEAKKLMGTEFENLSTKIFETKSKQFSEENKNNIQNLLNPIQCLTNLKVIKPLFYLPEPNHVADEWTFFLEQLLIY